MTDRFPEGKSFGWMQAPPQWIVTHTVRFIGIVRVVIQDGEGFILIKKGKPLIYYFRHGRIELHGHEALDYFNAQPAIEFNLCKYTPAEFSQALKIYNLEDTPRVTAGRQGQARTAPAQEGGGEKTAEEPVEKFSHNLKISDARGTGPKTVDVQEQPPTVAAVTENPPVLQPSDLEDPDKKIIGQIKKLNAIVAISVFDEDRDILLMGDVEIEPLLKIARTMLATANKITPHLDWGPLVHMTLQIPEGNVIIAPYHENHLCILTTMTINIGHIRRILRDLHQDSHQEVME